MLGSDYSFLIWDVMPDLGGLCYAWPLSLKVESMSSLFSLCRIICDLFRNLVDGSSIVTGVDIPSKPFSIFGEF